MGTDTKQELAQTCGFNWKCKDECEQDWSKTCPEDWHEIPLNPGLCMAPSTYAGICSFSVSTSKMTAAQKAAFAAKCAANFQCLTSGPAVGAAEATQKLAPMPDGPVSIDGQVAVAQTQIAGGTERVEKAFHIPSGPWVVH